MQHDPIPERSAPQESSAGGLLASADAVKLLLLMGTLSSLRGDPRAWRQELLAGINRILPASASVAFILRNVHAQNAPEVANHFDAGFVSSAPRQAFLREINAAPFRDPLSLFALRRLAGGDLQTLTCLRSDAVDDAVWNANPHVLTRRRPSGMDDCLLSIHRGAEPGIVYAILALRAAPPRFAEGSAAGKKRLPSRFSPRERLLLDTLHQALDWIYGIEESAHRLNYASALAPRLRQTLDCLLAGDTERQVAQKMALSIHTVHGYVKSLYTHFGVSSRRELMARWIHISGRVQASGGE